MRILRYLTRDILLHTVAVSFVLFLVVFAGRFIRYLAEAAVGSLTGDVLLPIMLFKLPGFFEMILPLGSLHRYFTQPRSTLCGERNGGAQSMWCWSG